MGPCSKGKAQRKGQARIRYERDQIRKRQREGVGRGLKLTAVSVRDIVQLKCRGQNLVLRCPSFEGDISSML